MRAAVLTVSPRKAIFFLDRAHFAGHHGATMQSGPAVHGGAEVAQIDRAQQCQSVECGKASAYATRVGYANWKFPTCDYLIADIAMDLAVGCDDRGGDIDDKTIDEAVECEFAEPLGQRHRALDIDK